MILAFDLDGVVFEMWEGDYHPEKVGKVMKGCIETFNWIRDRGHEIVIFTCRTNPEINEFYRGHSVVDLVVLVMNHLREAGIPYHRVSIFKPAAHWYFDDRANFTTWEGVKDKVKELEDEY